MVTLRSLGCMSCLLVFRVLRYWSCTGKEDDKKHGKTVIVHNYYNSIHLFCKILRHVLHFDVGRSQIEWNLKLKNTISDCTAIMLNDHSNPYRDV